MSKKTRLESPLPQIPEDHPAKVQNLICQAVSLGFQSVILWESEEASRTINLLAWAENKMIAGCLSLTTPFGYATHLSEQETKELADKLQKLVDYGLNQLKLSQGGSPIVIPQMVVGGQGN
jgi:hypothetical protein